jgi:hypothetical protein
MEIAMTTGDNDKGNLQKALATDCHQPEECQLMRFKQSHAWSKMR